MLTTAGNDAADPMQNPQRVLSDNSHENDAFLNVARATICIIYECGTLKKPVFRALCEVLDFTFSRGTMSYAESKNFYFAPYLFNF